MLIIECLGCRKTNALLNLISHQTNSDKNHLYAKDPSGTKYQLSINKRGGLGLRHCNGSKTEYSKDIQDVHKSIEEYNPHGKRKVLPSTNSNRFIYQRQKTKNFNIFVAQYYFDVPKFFKLNSKN